jgi:hypothetical protein
MLELVALIIELMPCDIPDQKMSKVVDSEDQALVLY